MSALTWAVIMNLAANPACSWPGMVPEFWPAVVRGEGGHDPLALHDDDTNRAYHPSSPDEAVWITSSLMAQGHSVGVGLSQLTARSPSAFLAKFKITLRQAMEPCTNMQVGASHYVIGSLSVYNSGHPTRSIPYARRIMDTIGQPNTEGGSRAPPSNPHVQQGWRDLLHGKPNEVVPPASDLIQIPRPQVKDSQP